MTRGMIPSGMTSWISTAHLKPLNFPWLIGCLVCAPLHLGFRWFYAALDEVLDEVQAVYR